MLMAYCVSEPIRLEAMVEIKNEKVPTELRKFLGELGKKHGSDKLDILEKGTYLFSNSITGYSFKVVCTTGKKTYL
jgi:hypothetical protein